MSTTQSLKSTRRYIQISASKFLGSADTSLVTIDLDKVCAIEYFFLNVAEENSRQVERQFNVKVLLLSNNFYSIPCEGLAQMESTYQNIVNCLVAFHSPREFGDAVS